MNLKFELKGRTHNFRLDSLTQCGAGGEGVVYFGVIDGTSYAFKIFHKTDSEKIKKICAAINVTPKSAIYTTEAVSIVQLAWPQAVLKDVRDKPIGFVMPYVDRSEVLSLEYFTDPVLASSNDHSEPLNVVFKVRIARNLCSVVKSLHDVGHFFIDFKPQNVLVYKKSGQVCLVDCDSYSIYDVSGRYPANAFSSEFICPVALVNQLPPERLGEDQDNWAVAVALFKLFNLGMHPYGGIISPSIKTESIDDNVKMGLYAHGLVPNSLITPRKLSAHSLLPKELRELFDKAFSNGEKAPNMSAWISYFDCLLEEKAFNSCKSFPRVASHIRFKDMDCIACFVDTQRQKFQAVISPSVSRTQNNSASSASVSAGNQNSKPILSSIPIPNNRKPANLWPLWLFLLVIVLLFILNIDSGDKTQTMPPNNYIKQDSNVSSKVESQSQPLTPTSVTEGSYVSVFTSNRYAVGLSFRPTAMEAKQEAQAECERQISQTSDTCIELVTQQGECLGISRASSGALGMVIGDSPLSVGTEAEEVCKRNGGTDCSPGYETTFCRQLQN